MPSSQHYHISKIMNLIVALKPNSVLDIGSGYGKYGVLCREYLELWDGRQNYNQRLRRIDSVEVFKDYITPIHDFVYDHVYVGNILTLIDEIHFHYDLVLLIDVLEHFSKTDGTFLLKTILERNGGIIISTPKNPTVQTGAFGNVFETHMSKWTKSELDAIGDSLFIRDSVSVIGYLSKNRQMRKLKNELILKNIEKNPSISSLISNWKYHSNKYIKSKLFGKTI